MAGVWRTAMRFSIDGATVDLDDVITTFSTNFTPAGVPGPSDFADLHSAIEGDWWSVAKAEWGSQITLEDLTTTRVDVLPSPVPVVETVGVAGTYASGNPLPPQISVAFSWRTALAGRSYRGRSFMPPPNTARVGIDGLLDSGSQSDFADAAKLLVDSVNGAGATNLWDFGVWSRTLEVFTPVSSIKVGNRVDVIRSRAYSVETYVTRTPA